MRYFVPVALIFVFLLAGCATTPVQRGVMLGGALGGASGAVIGHQSGHQGEGALIGAGTGAVLGALIGDGQRPRPQPKAAQRPLPPPPPANYSQPGHYEMRLKRGPSGEYYEERVWVPGR